VGAAADPRLPRTLGNRLIDAGFHLDSAQVLPLFNPSFDPNSYSARMIDLIASYVTGRNGITREDAESWANGLRHAGEEGEYFFSLNRYLFLARSSGGLP